MKCPVCKDLLGPLPAGATKHPLCEWANADDWRALRPLLTGDFLGVHASGS
jgi:hypothetical protein